MTLRYAVLICIILIFSIVLLAGCTTPTTNDTNTGSNDNNGSDCISKDCVKNMDCGVGGCNQESIPSPPALPAD